MKPFVLFRRIKNETPMLLIQRYNGFNHGTRNNHLGSIREEEIVDAEKSQRSKDSQGTLYSRHSLESTTDYASDDEEESEGDENQSQIIRKHGISNFVHFQRKIPLGLRTKHKFTKTANEKWPHSHPVNMDNFLLHKPLTSTRATNESIEYSLISKSDQCFQTLSEESEICDSEEFPSKMNIQVHEYSRPTLSKTNYISLGPQSRKCQFLPDDIHTYKEWIESTFKSFNQEPTSASFQISKHDSVESFPNILTENIQILKTKARDVTSSSYISHDNFYKTFLPSSLAENESVTKINPIAILYANQDEEENSLNEEERKTMPMKNDDKENSSEKREAEFVYSVEDFPHPPDYFFEFDSFSSVSLVTGSNEEDKKETEKCCGHSMTTGNQICQNNRHFNFMGTNQNKEVAVDSFSDCYSEFVHQNKRESDFICQSVSTEFTLETNPNEQHSTLDIPIATLKTIPNDYPENSDSGLMDSCAILKHRMSAELNNDDVKTRQDTEDVEDMYSLQISDTIIQSSICRSISTGMKRQTDNIMNQCETNSQDCLHLNKPRFFGIISTKYFEQTLNKTPSRKTNGRYSKFDHELDNADSDPVPCENAKSVSALLP